MFAYTDGALRSCRGSCPARYITGRVQPDKSIDVIDEVRCALAPQEHDQAARSGGHGIAQSSASAIEKDDAVKNADYEKAAELRDQAEKLRKEKERSAADLARPHE